MSSGRGTCGAAVSVLRPCLAAGDCIETLVLKVIAIRVLGFREGVKGFVNSFLEISFSTNTNTIRFEDDSLKDISSSFRFGKDISMFCAEEMGTNSFFQIHLAGVRFIFIASAAGLTEWKPLLVVRGAVSDMQALWAMSNRGGILL